MHTIFIRLLFRDGAAPAVALRDAAPRAPGAPALPTARLFDI
jgi:hypothetical protein